MDVAAEWELVSRTTKPLLVLDLLGGEGVGDRIQSPVASDLTNHAYVTDHCKHPSMMGFKELLSWCIVGDW